MRLSAPALLVLFTLALPCTSFAIQGDGSYQHIDATRSHRIASPAVQDRLSQTPEYVDFLARRGGSWRVLWDEATRTPTRLSGSGWDVPPERLANDKEAWLLGREILTEERALLGGDGIDLSDLEPWTLDRSHGITTLTWKRLWNGLAVVDARISLRFKSDRFVMAQFESMPDIKVSSVARVPSDSATLVATNAMNWSTADFYEHRKPELVVLPLLRGLESNYRLAWSLRLRAKDFPSSRRVFVDAHSGEFLGWIEMMRFMDGQVLAEHDDRFPDNGTSTSPMAHAELSGNNASLSADMDGLFTLSTNEPVSLDWSVGSEWFDIRAVDGNGRAVFSDEFTTDGDILTASADDSLSGQGQRRQLAQIDAHVSAHIVRKRGLSIRPDFSWAESQVVTRVNDGESRCNAWFDEESTLNFVIQGQGCNNTARLADVVYHEYGHGFHLWNIISGAGGWGDGSLGEGLSDYMSATITNSSDLAPGFFRQTNAPLRQLEGDYRWPEDIEEDPHQTGLIIASALWHLREGLIAEYGSDAGIEHADFLYLNAARRAAEIPLVYDELLLADDDDGNLSNGTPNQCIIDEAFARHGLSGQGGSGAAQINHEPPVNLPAFGDDITIEVASGLSGLNCLDSDLASVIVHWSYDSEEGSFASASLNEDPESGVFTGVLPSPPTSNLIQYYIEAFSDDGELLGRLPQGSVSDPWYGLWVGPAQTIYFSDFEEDDGGFSHELISESEQLGADDWQWGEPQGAEGDPVTAWSGDMVWGNDLALESNWNGAYQAEVHNVLSSPEIDLPERAPGDRLHVQFRRWLNVEDGFFDQAILSVNGTEIWTQLNSGDPDAGQHHQDRHWAMRSYDVTEVLSDDTTLRIDWEIVSDGGLQMGGWNLDDVRVLQVAEAPTPTPGDGDDDDSDELSGPDIFTASGCTCSAGASPTRASSRLVFLALALLFVLPRRWRLRPR
jgi:hypothetical protein